MPKQEKFNLENFEKKLIEDKNPKLMETLRLVKEGKISNEEKTLCLFEILLED